MRHIFAEKNPSGVLELRRNFQLAAREKVLVVEDVVTRGGRVWETIGIVRVLGGEVVLTRWHDDHFSTPVSKSRAPDQDKRAGSGVIPKVSSKTMPRRVRITGSPARSGCYRDLNGCQSQWYPSPMRPGSDVPHFSLTIWPPTSPGHRFAAWDRSDVAA